MKLIASLLFTSALFAETVKVEVADQLSISINNSKLLNAKVDLNDKEQILKFAEEQVRASRQNIDAVSKERAELIQKLIAKYKLAGKTCNIDNIQAELICEVKEVKKEK